MRRFIASFLIALVTVGRLSAFTDSDGDGLEDSVETNTGVFVDAANTGTDPNHPDTDGDGAGDWYEVAASYTSPVNAADKPNTPYPLADPDPSDSGAVNKPVKVYILSGQSNMLGSGKIAGTESGTLATLTGTEMKFPNLVAAGGGWTVRNDVQYRGLRSDIGSGPLAADVAGTSIGPELGFGHVVGHFHDEPVLLLKVCEGQKRLGSDILPPGSASFEYGSLTYAGYGQSPYSWTTGTTPVPTASYAGLYYDQFFLDEADWAPAGTGSVTNPTDILDDFATEYPQWAAQGFEIAGFVWWQGHTDQWMPLAGRYEQNLVRLIKQLRQYYANRYPGKCSPSAPFALATIAYNGWDFETNPMYGADSVKVLHAQLAVSGEAGNYPEFVGNVKTAEARGYWRPSGPNPSDQAHYYQNAETYMLVGDALGRAMVDLQADDAPPTPDPMDFRIGPAAVDATTVGMVAVTATDATGPVEYCFENTTNGDKRDWNTEPRWDNTGLSPGSYNFRVKARDGRGNETAWSALSSGTPGADITAPLPAQMSFASPPAAHGESSLTMTATAATDINGVEYYFECSGGGASDSGWQDAPAYTATGLSPGTLYSYRVRARDKSPAQNATDWSASASATTAITPPTLDSLVPATGATGVSMGVHLVATFSEPVVAGTGFITLRRSADQSMVESFDVESSTRLSFSGVELAVDPTDDLEPETQYFIQIDTTAVRDVSGAGFAGIDDSMTWTFSTAAASSNPGVLDTASHAGSGWDATTTYTLPSSTFGSFNPAGSSKLVATIGGRALNDTTPLTVAGITYNGMPMTKAVEQSNGRTVTAIYYLDSPPSAGDLVATYDVASVTTAVSLISLGGTLDGVASTASSPTLSTNLAAVPGVVIAAGISGHPATLITPQPPLTSTGLMGGYYFKAGAGHAEVADSGTRDISFTADGAGNAVVAAAFSAPAPTGGITFADWIGDPAFGLAPEDQGFGDDPDNDGIANGLENYFGTHPGVASQGLVAGAVHSAGNAFSFSHPINLDPDENLSAAYVWSSDLIDFHGDGAANTAGTTSVSFSQPTIEGALGTVTATITGPVIPNRLFIRVEVTQP